MRKIELFLGLGGNKTRMDISKPASISLSQKVLDLQDISKMHDKYSYTISLSGTSKNVQYFQGFGTNINFTTRSGNNIHHAELVIDDELFFKGNFLLEDYDQEEKEYNGKLYGELLGIVSKLKSRKVRELGYLNSLNHVVENASDFNETLYGRYKIMTKANYTNKTIASRPLIYPHIDFQGLGYFHNNNVMEKPDGTKFVPFYSCFEDENIPANDVVVKKPLDITKVPPAFEFLPIVKSIFTEVGYTVDLTALENGAEGDKWKNLYIQTPLRSKGKDKSETLSYDATGRFKSYHRNISNTAANIYERVPMFKDWSADFLGNEHGYLVPADGDYTVHIKGLEISAYFYQYRNGYRVNYGVGKAWLREIDTNGLTVQKIAIPLSTYNSNYGDFVINADIPLNGAKLGSTVDVYIEVPSGGILVNGKMQHYHVTLQFDNGTMSVTTGMRGGSVIMHRKAGDYFSELKQSDLIKEFLALSKSVMVFDNDKDIKHVKIIPLLDLWKNSNTVSLDITSKIDRSKGFKVIPSYKAIPKIISYNWKQTDDFNNIQFKGLYGVNYGGTPLTRSYNDQGSSEFNYVSKIFAPYCVSAVPRFKKYETGQEPYNVLKAYKGLEKFDKSFNSFRLFLWDKTTTDRGMKIYIGGFLPADVVTLVDVPFISNFLLTHADNYKVKAHTQDINFSYANPFDIEVDAANHNNLFTRYIDKLVQAVYDHSSIILEVGVYLTPNELKNLDLFAPIMLDGNRYRILEYKDYPLGEDGSFTMTLIKDVL